MDNTITKRAFSIDEAAQTLGVHPTSVRKMIQKGELAHVRIGDRILIPVKVIDAFLGKAEAGRQWP